MRRYVLDSVRSALHVRGQEESATGHREYETVGESEAETITSRMSTSCAEAEPECETVNTGEDTGCRIQRIRERRRARLAIVKVTITIVKQPDGTFKQVSAKKNVSSSSDENTEKLSKDETIEQPVEKEHEADASVSNKPEIAVSA
ncbi:hypothetical protein AAVH_05133 [Aphelenchoides avenae]|nr:hypothetical protein AAVH_05133 [Aphelenchus avenae]